jgi:hypothetical protein
MIYCYQIKTTSIDYCVEAEDLWFLDDVEDLTDEDFDREIERIKNELPQEVELEITCEPEDLEDEIADAIAEEIGWLVNNFGYDIISRKETIYE